MEPVDDFNQQNQSDSNNLAADYNAAFERDRRRNRSTYWNFLGRFYDRFLKSHVSQTSSLEHRRIFQLIVLVFATTFVALLNNFFHDQSDASTKIYLILSLLLGACVVLLAKGKDFVGSQLFLWTLYVAITSLMVLNEGLRDPVVFGYVGIGIFAAMLGNKTLYLIHAWTTGLTILAVGMINHFGWIDYSKVPFGWGTVIDHLLIYAVISYSVWVLANDLRFSLSYLEDEHERVKKSEQEFQRIAHYDNLTGLPNRIIACDRFSVAVYHAQRDANKVAVLFLDLDNFKTVNDSLGHAVGDILLQEIAQRLRASVREVDTVCRLGGDEFLVVLDGIQEEVAVTKISEAILKNIGKPIIIDDHNVTSTCSIGIAMSPIDGDNFEELRKKADMAMYKAKSSGRNAYMFFDEGMNKDMLTHIDRVNGLRSAIDNQEFELYFQPKVDLKSRRIFSAEALLRWITADGQIVLPEQFIPIAEKTGLILQLGKWVLFDACSQCKQLQKDGYSDFSIAVNLSALQFRRGDLEEVVKNALDSSGLHPSYLELEVTESLLMDDDKNIRKQIRSLQSIGVTFSVDDFGTGYSSLAYLRDFNFDFLKIDKSFTYNCYANEQDMALCEAIVVMAHKLKLMVVAEGIENEEQLKALVKAGCEFGQGHYFSEPINAQAMLDLLLKNKQSRLVNSKQQQIDF